jgi:hypothetical protein
MRAGVAVQNSPDAAFCGFGNHRARVVFRITCVHYDRLAGFLRKSELPGEGTPLLGARRIVVVIIEPALAYRDSASMNELPQQCDISLCIESDCIMRMHARREPDEARTPGRDAGRRASGAEDIPGAAARADADDGLGSVFLGALDYRAAVTVERRVGEVRVAVDVPLAIPVFLGHFLSIQRSVGPAM